MHLPNACCVQHLLFTFPFCHTTLPPSLPPSHLLPPSTTRHAFYPRAAHVRAFAGSGMARRGEASQWGGFTDPGTQALIRHLSRSRWPDHTSHAWAGTTSKRGPPLSFPIRLAAEVPSLFPSPSLLLSFSLFITVGFDVPAENAGSTMFPTRVPPTYSPPHPSARPHVSEQECCEAIGELAAAECI